MIQAGSLSTYRRRESVSTVLLMAGGILLTLLLAAMLSGMTPVGGVMPGVLLLAALLLAPLVWRWPESSSYLLLATAILIEEHPLGFGLSLTDQVPAFTDVQAMINLPGLAFNPVELLAAFAIGVCLLKSSLTNDTFRLGTLAKPWGLFLGLILLGLVRGKLAGGEMEIALWGVRGTFLMFFAYILTTNVIRTRAQVRALGAILIVATAFKGVIGLWRYAVDAHGHLSFGDDTTTLMAHEESFFYLLIVFTAVLALAFGLMRKDRRAVLISLALVMLPLLANQRRAAIAALMLGLILLFATLYKLQPGMRRGICRSLILAVFILPPYFAIGWNNDTLLTMPVQAVRSGIDPNKRDQSSNEYRITEDRDLRATARTNPLFGVGFGRPMKQDYLLPDISATYNWYLYLPHNNILWLGMTMGLLGLLAFVYLMGSVALQSVGALVASQDAELRLLYALGLAGLTSFLIFTLLDQGLISQRMDIFVGVFMGLLSLPLRLGQPLPRAERPPLLIPTVQSTSIRAGGRWS